MPYDDQALARDIRALLKARKCSARSLSQSIGLPYRSMQNYLSGESRMPASVLVNVLDFLGTDIRELRSGDRLLQHGDLYDAIWRVFGDALLDIDLEKIGSTVPFSPQESTPELIAQHADRIRIAGELAVRLSEAYDQFAREHNVPGPMPTIREIRSRRQTAVSESDDNSAGGEVGQ